MTKIKNNPLLKGASGKMGDVVVYRNVRGKVIMANPPKRSEKEPTENQLEVRDRFLEAVEYANAVSEDAAAKAAYEAYVGDRYTSFRAAAMADYLRYPRIRPIDTSLYKGAVGDTIVIKVIKEFKGLSVRVTIARNDGSVLEAGDAVQQSGKLTWTYTATAVNATLAGTKLIVRVTDKPGNVIAQETVL